jgi:3-phosphoshikimate 1-carboxyvinyltransferase
MKASIYKSVIDGIVKAPSSKSYTIRALICAALANGESRIFNPLYSDDTKAAIDVLSKVGIQICREKESLLVSGGVFNEAVDDLYCGDSATTLRFMAAISSLIPGRTRLVTGFSLAKRPIETLIITLRKLGVDCHCNGGVAPVVVEDSCLTGGTVEMAGDISSQFVSALLLIAPFADKGIKIKLTSPLESKPYVLMTIECLREFGIMVGFSEDMAELSVLKQSYKPTEYVVEGDWSSASYLLALGALSGKVKVNNLKSRTVQGDKIILDFLRRMGAIVYEYSDSVVVKASGLKALNGDLTDCIDLLPTMAVLAACADGCSELRGVRRGRIKESNRVTAVVEGLKGVGLEVIEESNRLLITGGSPEAAVIDSYGDHRIAMAFAILGLKSGGITITGAECVSKTFPEFWSVINNIGGRITVGGK